MRKTVSKSIDIDDGLGKRLRSFLGKIVTDASIISLPKTAWRHLVGRRAADQIAAHGDDRLAALGPKHRHDGSRSRSPIRTGNGCLLDFESIHKLDDVESNYRLLGIAKRITQKKTCYAITARVRDNRPVAGRRQQGSNVDKAVNVVRPAMQKNHRRTSGRASFSLADTQKASVDLLQWPNDVFVPGLIAGRAAGLVDYACTELIMTSSARGDGHGGIA
jgi:hypothetical protein